MRFCPGQTNRFDINYAGNLKTYKNPQRPNNAQLKPIKPPQSQQRAFRQEPQSLLTTHPNPMSNEPMTDYASKEANQQVLSPNQLLAKNLRKINQAIDNLACASAAANQPERAQPSSMVIHHNHHQQRTSEQKKPVDVVNQRLANFLHATTSENFGHHNDTSFNKKVSKNARLDAPSKDRGPNPPPLYEEDFRIPILYNTIASLEFQNSKLIQTKRLLQIRNSRNLHTLIAEKQAAEESLRQQADIMIRDMQALSSSNSNSGSSSSSINSTTTTTTTVWKHLEVMQKTLSGKTTALEILRRDNSNLATKQAEELRFMQNKIDELMMEKGKSDLNVTALVWSLVGLAAMWVLGLMLWWDI